MALSKQTLEAQFDWVQTVLLPEMRKAGHYPNMLKNVVEAANHLGLPISSPEALLEFYCWAQALQASIDKELFHQRLN